MFSIPLNFYHIHIIQFFIILLSKQNVIWDHQEEDKTIQYSEESVHLISTMNLCDYRDFISFYHRVFLLLSNLHKYVYFIFMQI